MLRTLTIPFITLAIALLALTAQAQVYRWVDENGNVHFSQTPPPGVEAKTTRPPPKVSNSPNQQTLNESLEDDIEGRAEKEAEAEKTAQEMAVRQQRCQQAREALASLGTVPANRLFKTDANGEVTRATEDDVATRRAEFERSASENCS